MSRAKLNPTLLSKRTAIAMARPRPPQCDGCPANPTHPSWDPMRTGGFVAPFGEPDSPILAVGISGGEEEEELGRPFVGPSGRKLTRAVQWASGDGGPLAPPSCLRTINVMNCRALKVGMQGKVVNRTPPTAEEMRSCAERWLYPELTRTTARIVLLLGTDAFNFVMGRRFGEFAKAMGHRLVMPRKGITPSGLGKQILTYGETYEL